MSKHASKIRLIMELRRSGITDTRVLGAIERIPREEFVLPTFADQAYENLALPIGHGQTISQPYVVAMMSQALQVEEKMKVLEVGTGSGYQAAVLSRLVERVCSIEIVPELAAAAAARLARLGLHNVEVRRGDGWSGWPEHAPYDGIVVTAACARVPDALVAQLRPGGRLMVPVRSWVGEQELMLVEKDAAGGVRQRHALAVAFVPLTRR